MGQINQPTFRRGEMPPPPAPCNRRDLACWAGRGGPLPSSLAEHVATCNGCAERVRRINQVNTALTLLRTGPMPAGMAHVAGSRALAMLRRAVRISVEARLALEAGPNLTRWQRTQLQLTRASMAAAATIAVLLLRTGISGGFERTRTVGEILARSHWDRHIDPDREWLDPEHSPWTTELFRMA